MDIKINLCNTKIFDNDMVAIQNIKTTLTRNIPSYVGMRMLALSKVPLYELHYNYIKNKYSKKIRFLFTDTDSLLYETETENVYGDFSKNKKKVWF